MIVKEFKLLSNIAWSPANEETIYIAAGSAAQRLDETFDTESYLYLYELDLKTPGMCMKRVGDLKCKYRFDKLIWLPTEILPGFDDEDVDINGFIVGGEEEGSILVCDPYKLMCNKDSVVWLKKVHNSSVVALDFNKFQNCVFASGASESEIFIWDLNDLDVPLKMKPVTELDNTSVKSLAWNPQVNHILASTFPSICAIWDLRKTEPVMRVSDRSSLMHCKTIAWNPVNATQLCIASDDDRCPVIQLWDLRYATFPVRNLENHTRGVLSIAWCENDSDMLLSTAKDGRTLCWNPNSLVERGDVLCEFPVTPELNFDVSWCPKNAALVACCNSNGYVQVHSLMHYDPNNEWFQKKKKTVSSTGTCGPLRKTPKWFKTPMRASFAFGGKLTTKKKDLIEEIEDDTFVRVHQISTEAHVSEFAKELQDVLVNHKYDEYLQKKIATACNESEKMNWSFIKVMFFSNKKAEFLRLLGYDIDNIEEELERKNKCDETPLSDLMKSIESLDLQEYSSPSSSSSLRKRLSLSGDVSDEDAFDIISDNTDALLNKALIVGNLTVAMDLSIKLARWADAFILARCLTIQDSSSSTAIDAVQQRVHNLYRKSVDSFTSRIICAIGTDDWHEFISYCDIRLWKLVFSLLIIYAKDFRNLCNIMARKLLSNNRGIPKAYSSLFYIASGNFDGFIENWVNHFYVEDSLKIQTIVIQAIMLRTAMERATKTALCFKSKESYYLIWKYGNLLSAEGCFNTAFEVVKEYEKVTAVASLKDRILPALNASQQVKFSKSDSAQKEVPEKLPEPGKKNPPVFKASFHHNFTKGKIPAQPRFHQEEIDHAHSNMPLTKRKLAKCLSNVETNKSTFIDLQQPSCSFSQPLFTHASTLPVSSYSIMSHGLPHDRFISMDSVQYSKGCVPGVDVPIIPSADKWVTFDDPAVNESSRTSVLSSAPSEDKKSETGTFVIPSASSEANVKVEAGAYVFSSQPFESRKIEAGWNDPPLLQQTPSKMKYSIPLTKATNQSIQGHLTGVFPKEEEPQPEEEEKIIPFPSEHDAIRSTFTDLCNWCHSSTDRLLNKKKVDDCRKKFDIMYDLIRRQKLSSKVLTILHEMVELIDKEEFSEAFDLYLSLVQTGFSEISGFISGIKVLLQIAYNIQKK